MSRSSKKSKHNKLAAKPRAKKKSEALPPAAADSEASSREPRPALWPHIWPPLALAAIYLFFASWGQSAFGDIMGYYDMFADALIAGQLHLFFTPDQVNLVDMIPYEGRYYFQWGPLPVVLHLLPRLAGIRISDRLACVALAVLTAWTFWRILLWFRRRAFPGVPSAVCLGWFFAFGLATPTLFLAVRGTVYNEAIAAAAALNLLGLFAVLRYFDSEHQKWLWLAGAACGGAFLCRITTVLFTVGIGLGFAYWIWRRGGGLPKLLRLVVPFAIPVALAISLQMGYNAARFGSPLDYGNRYKPEADRSVAIFSAARLPENIYNYFLAPPKFPGDFPWIEHTGWDPPIHLTRTEAVSSLVLASPFLLFAFAPWPLLRRDGADPPTQAALLAAAGSGLALAVLMMLFAAASRRYAQDFLPALLVVAFVGYANLRTRGAPWLKHITWPAVAFIAISALFHVQIAFYQSFYTPTPDLNVTRAFLRWAPTIRGILPGPKLDEQEGMMRNDLGVFLMNQRRFRQAAAEFAQAAELLPNEERVRQNLESARRLSGGR